MNTYSLKIGGGSFQFGVDYVTFRLRRLLTACFQQSADVDCPAYNLKIVPAHQKMAKHRKKTGRVEAAEAVENIEANAVRGAPDAAQRHSFSRTIDRKSTR